MLKKQPWFTPDGGIEYEYGQACSEGLPVERLQAMFDAVAGLPPGSREKIDLSCVLYEAIAKIARDNPHSAIHEPDDLAGILKLAPNGPDIPEVTRDDAGLYGRIYGAWLGRCAGCLLGQPVEGWTRARIVGLCQDSGNWPVRSYLSSDLKSEIIERYGIVNQLAWAGNKPVNWINNVSGMPEDDDTNYTIIGLKILEKYGIDFSSDDVAECWLENLPLLHLCTAERVAYRNLANGIFPPDSARFRNPFREWIGAQIRGDFYGYISPGQPRKAAGLAWRDASISHVRNGIYGEMMVAAMLAAAAVIKDMNLIIAAGLSVIPENSRLAQAVRGVLDDHGLGLSADSTIDKIHADFAEKVEFDWCHTLPNARVVIVALLYGGGDLERTLGIALTSGFDTDCNCATAGSICGMMLGAAALPAHWVIPLQDTLKSGVDGFGKVPISELACRTVRLVAAGD